MPNGAASQLIEQRSARLKSRARTRQQWLEHMLAAPARTPAARVRRSRWITYALERIKQAQDDLAERASVLDAYAEHLHVLEMTLLGAAENHASKTAPAAKPAE